MRSIKTTQEFKRLALLREEKIEYCKIHVRRQLVITKSYFIHFFSEMQSLKSKKYVRKGAVPVLVPYGAVLEAEIFLCTVLYVKNHNS